MTTKTELGAWGFEECVLYLCAIVEKLHPTTPQGQLAEILAAARTAVRRNQPTDLNHLRILEPPSDLEKWRDIEQVADLIIDVSIYWSPPFKDEDDRQYSYHSACDLGRDAECIALHHLDFEDLAECALAAFAELLPDADEQDAAVAAMSIGHYDIALDILTRKE